MRPVNFGQMWYWPNQVWPNAVTAGKMGGEGGMEKNETKGWVSQFCPATPSHKHGLCPPFAFQQVERWGLGFRV